MPEQTCLPGMERAVPGPSWGAAAGLSKPHIRTAGAYQEPKPTLTWYPGASLVDVNIPRHKTQGDDRPKKPRGLITEWSDESRAHLKRFMATLRRDELSRALVVTLTYPAEFPAPEDHETYKSHLHTFTVYLRRKWKLCSGIWKLEFQTRGAAHYHLMLFGLNGEKLESVRAWVRETWYHIAHNGDKHLGSAGTQVDQIKSAGGAVSYLVKYLSKGDQTMPGNFSGRYWGKINVNGLPAAKPETRELSLKEAQTMQRLMRTKVRKDVERSRWKRFLDENREEFWRLGGRQFWESLKASRQGVKISIGPDGEPIGRECLVWMFKDERPIEIDGEKLWPVDPWQSLPIPHVLIARHNRRLPKRWKPRNNDRVRVMCDATEFIEELKRLKQPVGTFAQWIRQAPRS